jgi:hypothetical protein
MAAWIAMMFLKLHLSVAALHAPPPVAPPPQDLVAP